MAIETLRLVVLDADQCLSIILHNILPVFVSYFYQFVHVNLRIAISGDFSYFPGVAKSKQFLGHSSTQKSMHEANLKASLKAKRSEESILKHKATPSY